MNFKVAAACALVGAFFVAAEGCGSKEKREYWHEEYHQKTDSLDDARKLAQQARVFCESEKDCLPAVGMLVSVTATPDGAKMGACTASLIDSDLLLTNAHCIPDDLKREKQPGCTGRLYFALPAAQAHAEERFGCSQVLAHSNVINDAEGSETLHPDFAIVRLDRAISQRRWLEVSNEGLPDELPVTIYKAEIVKDTFGTSAPLSYQQRQECRFSYDSLRVPTFSHPFRPLGFLPFCQVHKGNSGSPLIDRAGKVRAVLQAGSNVEEDPAPPKRPVAADDGTESFAIATNLSCVQQLSRAPVSIECSVTPDSPDAQKSSDETTGRLSRRFNAKFQFVLDSSRKSGLLDPRFEWEPAMLKNEASVAQGLKFPAAKSATVPVGWAFGEPKCIVTTASLSRHDRRPETTRPFPLWPVILSWPVSVMKVELAGPPVTTRVKIKFAPEQAAKTGRGRVSITSERVTGDDGVIFSREIPVCGPTD